MRYITSIISSEVGYYDKGNESVVIVKESCQILKSVYNIFIFNMLINIFHDTLSGAEKNTIS